MSDYGKLEFRDDERIIGFYQKDGILYVGTDKRIYRMILTGNTFDAICIQEIECPN